MVNPERVRFLSPCLAGSNQPCRYQGKTTYLYLKIIEFLITGRPFLYQTKEGSVYHVTQNGVAAIESWSSKTHIVAFVDGDKGDYEPQKFLFASFVQIIVVSSPKGADQPWVKQASPSTTIITKFATCLWSPCEVFLTGLVSAFLLSTLDRRIFLGCSFILVTSLLSYSGSRSHMSATIPVNASMLPTL